MERTLTPTTSAQPSRSTNSASSRTYRMREERATRDRLVTEMSYFVAPWYNWENYFYWFFTNGIIYLKQRNKQNKKRTAGGLVTSILPLVVHTDYLKYTRKHYLLYFVTLWGCLPCGSAVLYDSPGTFLIYNTVCCCAALIYSLNWMFFHSIVSKTPSTR